MSAARARLERELDAIADEAAELRTIAREARARLARVSERIDGLELADERDPDTAELAAEAPP